VSRLDYDVWALMQNLDAQDRQTKAAVLVTFTSCCKLGKTVAVGPASDQWRVFKRTKIYLPNKRHQPWKC